MHLAVPMLEPGTYTACFGLPHWTEITDPSLLSRESKCVSGEMRADEELVLKLPSPAPVSPSPPAPHP